jgi:hypothetical protein
VLIPNVYLARRIDHLFHLSGSSETMVAGQAPVDFFCFFVAVKVLNVLACTLKLT